MPLICAKCNINKPMIKLQKTGHIVCKNCFYEVFETEIHETITRCNLFKRGDYVAIAASGGKDSTVLAYVLKLLNERYDYGLKLVLLSIDEGITGYRDDSLQTVMRNRDDYSLPLKILSYQDLYGWTMDAIVKKVGSKNNCTFCGVFRRQALDRGAALLEVDKVVTGHNADDIAETVIMNVLRGDIARLSRCTNIITNSPGSIPRCKPFKYTYEKEIVMYAHFKKLDYFSTECIYSPNAYRGNIRSYIKDLEAIQPRGILDIIYSGECLSLKETIKLPSQGICKNCGFISSQAICKACVMLEGLNTGEPYLGVKKSTKVKKKIENWASELKINASQEKISELNDSHSLNTTSFLDNLSMKCDSPNCKNEKSSTCCKTIYEPNQLSTTLSTNKKHVHHKKKKSNILVSNPPSEKISKDHFSCDKDFTHVNNTQTVNTSNSKEKYDERINHSSCFSQLRNELNVQIHSLSSQNSEMSNFLVTNSSIIDKNRKDFFDFLICDMNYGNIRESQTFKECYLHEGHSQDTFVLENETLDPFTEVMSLLCELNESS